MSNETYVTVIGRLTSDPELKTLQGGAKVANFTVAANPRVRNRESGQWEDGPASFHDCEAWQYMADHVASSLQKASRVIVYGALQQHAFTTREGENRRRWVIKIEEIGPSLRFVNATLSQPDSITRPNDPQPRNVGADPWASAGEAPF